MNPVAIVQHDADVGPGYFAQWLAERGLASETIRIDRGDVVPADPRRFAGICSLGGPMSVNDPLPWIAPEVDLLAAADRAAVPVIGHCLGGQLLARALGARVSANDVKEIGWGKLHVADRAVARDWLSARPDQVLDEPFETFQWHGDTFDLPAGARNFLASAYCARQAYVVERDGYAHLGMQFHCEMTPELIATWAHEAAGVQEVADELARGSGASVQTSTEMLRDVERRSAALNVFARRLYERWSRGLRR